MSKSRWLLFRLSDDAHDQERFRRRQAVSLFDRDVFLPTPEDVIVTKLRWMRTKDVDDVVNVIAVQADGLDWDYIEHWSGLHGTRTELDRLRTSVQGSDADRS